MKHSNRLFLGLTRSDQAWCSSLRRLQPINILCASGQSSSFPSFSTPHTQIIELASICANMLGCSSYCTQLKGSVCPRLWNMTQCSIQVGGGGSPLSFTRARGAEKMRNERRVLFVLQVCGAARLFCVPLGSAFICLRASCTFTGTFWTQ